MKFVKNRPDELDFNEKVMDLIKASKAESDEKSSFQYLICHGNVKYLINIEVDGRQNALERLGKCDYKTVPGL
jgi:hypothetical protein